MEGGFQIGTPLSIALALVLGVLKIIYIYIYSQLHL